MGSSLTTGEKKQLRDHEAVIEKGIGAFVEVGKSLVAIRDGKLYTDVDDTFEAYCKKRWSFSASRARQLIDASSAAQVIESVTNGNTLPPNERVARELAAIPSERKQADVWAKAVETAPKDSDGKPKVTAAHVRSVAAESNGKPKPADKAKPEPREAGDDTEVIEEEKTKVATTDDRMKEWNRQVEAFARSITAIIESAPEGGWMNEERRNIVTQQLKSAAGSARQAKCDKPCPLCDGSGCKRCHKTGFMPQRSYEMAGGK